MVPKAGRQKATLHFVRQRVRGAAWAGLLVIGGSLLLPGWVVIPLLLLVGGAWFLLVVPPGLYLPPDPPRLKTYANGVPSPSPRSLLMGSYLGHSESVTVEGIRGQQQRLREALQRPNPTVPSPQRRLSYGEFPSMSRFALTPRRRYPLQQTQYAMLGALPTVRWDGYQRKNVLSAKHSALAHSPVTVKIAPPDRIARSPIFDKMTSPVRSSTENIAPDPCARETVLNALKASRKRVVDDDCTALDGQDNKRRRHDSNVSGHSAFDSVLANGSPASLIPKPGILKRGLNAQFIDDNLSKRSRTSSISSVNASCTAGIPTSVRNAITSSYSSTRGLIKAPRSGPSTSPLSSPSTSRSQTPERPAKKNREDVLQQQSNTSTPRLDGMEQHAGKDLVFPVQKQNSVNSKTSPSSSDGKRKRKMQLLSIRRRDPLTLPPPPQLGYSVTAEDLEAEKKATLLYINKALEDPKAPSASAPTETSDPSLSFTLATSVNFVPATGSNSMLGSPKEIQKAFTVAEPVSVSTAIEPTSKPLASLARITSPASSSLATTTSDSKPLPTWGVTSPTLAQSPTSLDMSASAGSQTAVSMPAVTCQSGSVELPKPSPLISILLQKPIEDSPSASQSTGSSTNTLTFKPVFGTLPKLDSPMSSDISTSTSSSSMATTTTFKPIFGNLATPASMPVASGSPFSFGQNIGSALTSASASVPVESGSIFTALAQTASTTSASTSGTLADSCTKPSFAFGLRAAPSMPSNTNTTTNTSTAVPGFQFGVAASDTTTSSATSFGGTSIFQFSKPATSTATISASSVQPVVSTFGQASSSSTPASNSFIFGSTPATAPSTTGTSQTAMSFGSSASFFSGGSSNFNMNSNPPAYPNPSSQTAPTTKPTVMTFGSAPTPFNFGSTSQIPAQTTFVSGSQPAFGSSSQASFAAIVNTQPAFGNAKPVLSLGPSTTIAASGFGSAAAQTTSGSIFGSTAQNQFGFASSSQPGNSSVFGLATQSSSAAAPSLSGFSFGSAPNAVTTNASAFGTPSITQNVMSTPNQNSTFAFGAANTPDNRLTFGGTSTPTFGQSSPAVGGSLSFGTPSAPTIGFSTPGPSFGSPAPAFSIGAGSKPSGTRQRLQARRQHTRKK